MNSHSSWAEIDLDAVAHNLREVRRVSRPQARIMAVVKADAYGHGAPVVARTALENGADTLGVARAEEGLALRRAGIRAPILVFGYSPPELAGELLEHDLTQTIFSLEQARYFSTVAGSRRQTLKAHLKIDTGMGRLGFVANPAAQGGAEKDGLMRRAIEQVSAVARLPFLDIEGIYTHFAAADGADKASARRQFTLFHDFLARLQRLGMRFPLRHAANSAAIIDLPETHLDMVRAGIMLHGLYPSAEVNRERVELRPAMQLKARVAQVREVPAGFRVSYGSTYEAPRPTRLATVTVGYADGYSRLLSSRGSMLVRGCRAPVVGRVCMDQTVLDVGQIEGVRPGDEVVVFGRQGNECIPAEQIALATGTINYEIVSTITARVPRIYVDREAV
jgi:alanine racemase